MIDLINNNPDKNNLIEKYSSLIIFTKDKKQIPQFLYILDISINHIKSNHNTVDPIIKAWTMFIIKHIYEDNNILIHESDINEIINNFIIYYDSKHEEYLKNVEVYSSIYDRDYHFMMNYINEKIIPNKELLTE